jgi:hypothetical protein
MIAEISDWRGPTFAKVRKAILAADPEIVEEWKWMGSPVWYRHGIIAVANAHKEKVKITFSNGAQLDDPDKLFNNGLQGGKWRSIDLLEGDKVNERALRDLVRAAIAYNQSKVKPSAARSRAAKSSAAKPSSAKKVAAKKTTAAKKMPASARAKKAAPATTQARKKTAPATTRAKSVKAKKA